MVGGWVLTHNLVKPTLLVKVELGFDKFKMTLMAKIKSNFWDHNVHFGIFYVFPNPGKISLSFLD